MTTYRTNQDTLEFSLPNSGYAAFDAASLKNLIIDRLNSNEVFTDQNFEGSNINAFIDVISYAYHVLLFYLNNTSNETLFSESQIYENINRIVKSLDYKPVGTQSAVLSINAVASGLMPVGTYTIPRYSYIDIGGYRYSFNSDTTFVKLVAEEQNIEQMSGSTLLYQGTYKEYPVYTAAGDPNEVLTLVPGENVNVDHFNIDVYVQEGGTEGQYHKYDVTSSLLFERPTSRRVEIRLNESKRYEIKFGNDVNGRRLLPDDRVFIYYLSPDGSAAEASEFDAVRKSVTLYESIQFSNLKLSDNIRGDGVVYASQSITDQVLISNEEPSSKFYTGETVEDIRKNAPQTFSSQYRLVTVNDYESYIKTNFSNFISDVKTIDNDTYLNTHIKYYYDIGLKQPNLESRVLYNQVQFSSSCNFNNLYVYAVPRLEKTTSETKRSNFLTSAQKEIIIDRLSQIKTITCSPIIMDPVYVSVNLNYKSSDEELTTNTINSTNLLIVQDDNSRANSNDIIQKVVNIIKKYFESTTAKIGMTIDITSMSNEILTTQGVSTFYTYRSDKQNSYVEGLSLLVWNPVYTSDVIQTTQNYKLPIFKFPFFTDIEQLGNRVRVVRSSDASTVLAAGERDSTASDVGTTNIVDTTLISDQRTTVDENRYISNNQSSY